MTPHEPTVGDRIGDAGLKRLSITRFVLLLEQQFTNHSLGGSQPSPWTFSF